MKPITTKSKFRSTTEQRYNRFLSEQKLRGDIIDFQYEKLKINLGGVFYTPDFFIVYEDHFEVHEVKGFNRQVGKNKFKQAADLMPWFVWKMVFYKNGVWVYEQ